MSRFARGFAVLAMLSIVVPAPGANPKPSDDQKALQGNWKPLQCEYQGEAQMPTDVMKQVTAVYDKSEFYLYFVDKARDGSSYGEW